MRAVLVYTADALAEQVTLLHARAHSARSYELERELRATADHAAVVLKAVRELLRDLGGG